MYYSMDAEPVERGCGTRTEGDIYLTTGLGKVGKPLEEFLLCSPVPVPTWMGLQPLGLRLFARKNDQGVYVTHVADWVGSQHYPNVADFIEEVRRFGLSRKIAKTVLAQKTLATWDAMSRQMITIPVPPLCAESRIFLAHSKAWVNNPLAFCDAGVDNRCPKELPEHWAITEHTYCLGLCYHSVTGGTPKPGGGPNEVIRTMPSFSYTAHSAPTGVTPEYKTTPAFFARFPITMLDLVESNDPEINLQNVKLCQTTNLHYSVVPK